MGDRGEHGVPERADMAAAGGGAVDRAADDSRTQSAGWLAAGGPVGQGVGCAACAGPGELWAWQYADDHIPADTVDRGDGGGVLFWRGDEDGGGAAQQVAVWHRWRGNSAVCGAARTECVWRSVAVGAAGYSVAHGVEFYKGQQVSAIAAVPADDAGAGNSCDAAAGADGEWPGQCVQGIWPGAAVLLYTAHLPDTWYSSGVQLPVLERRAGGAVRASGLFAGCGVFGLGGGGGDIVPAVPVVHAHKNEPPEVVAQLSVANALRSHFLFFEHYA